MVEFSTGLQVRLACRSGEFQRPTCGVAPGYVQANLVILPNEWAAEFKLFCERNPGPCPLIEVTDVGDPIVKRCAAGADLRSDLPRYWVWRNGVLAEELSDIGELWQEDFVGFLLGCSLSFESVLLEQGVPLRHLELGRTPPVYKTSLRSNSAGRFSGPMVVSMRPLSPSNASLAAAISARYPIAHGGPIHLGDPDAIGIGQLDRPDYGDAPEIREGEIPVFWPCGITPLVAVAEAKPPMAITHRSGYMFVTDLKMSELGGTA